MKNLILFFFLVLVLFTNADISSQVSTAYTFSQFQGTYYEIAGDSAVAVATHTSIDPFQLNNVSYGPNYIPFTFPFNGAGYSSFFINSNGFITFGATAPTLTNYDPVSSSEVYKGAVSAFGMDLIGLFGTTVNFSGSTFTLTNVANFEGVVAGRHITAATGIKANTYIVSFDKVLGTITLSQATDDIIVTGLAVQIAAGSIVRSTEGTAPYRVHTIQFKNFRQYLIIGTNDNFNFQIKLFETTGAIHIVYGNMDEMTTSGEFGQVGLRGLGNTDFNNRTNSVSLNWAASTAGGANAATCKLSSTLFPVSGLTYVWGPVPAALNIKVIPQGFFNLSTLNLNMRDTVTAYLRNATIPYDVVDTARAVIDSVTFTGQFLFKNIPSGTYYIVVRHRNSIETMSKNGVYITSGGSQNYDFTNSITQAYGDNMINVNASPVRSGIFSGDVNQDGYVDLNDIGLVFNDAGNFVSGYFVTDVTGDNIVDLSDLTITYNNSSNFVSVKCVCN